MAFKPNALTFKEGQDRIKKGTAGAIRVGQIVSSRDPEIDNIVDALHVTNVPSGFTKLS